jgi:hypothetical protein
MANENVASGDLTTDAVGKATEAFEYVEWARGDLSTPSTS